jgi:hypothetical protein
LCLGRGVHRGKGKTEYQDNEEKVMSNFNDANNLASELVFGRYYQSEEPCPKPERLVFVGGDSTAVVTAKEETHAEWAEVANTIHRLFNRVTT